MVKIYGSGVRNKVDSPVLFRQREYKQPTYARAHTVHGRMRKKSEEGRSFLSFSMYDTLHVKGHKSTTCSYALFTSYISTRLQEQK
jgi:hypothetical protein